MGRYTESCDVDGSFMKWTHLTGIAHKGDSLAHAGGVRENRPKRHEGTTSVR